MYNKIVNIVFVMACVSMVVSALLYVPRELKYRYAMAHMPHIEVGQTLKVPGFSNKTTLVMELSTSCPHCKADEPLYKQLSGLPKVRSGEIQIVTAMISEEESQAREFVKRDLIPGELIYGGREAEKLSFPFLPTPALLLLDSNGKVTKKWSGEVHGDLEREFLAALR